MCSNAVTNAMQAFFGTFVPEKQEVTFFRLPLFF